MRVVFVQKFVPHYRLPFFERVRELLSSHGIDFVLIYCEPDPYEKSKVQMVFPDWGIRVSTRHYSLLNRYLYWGGIYRHLKRNDIVIVEHAAKLIDNYLIYVARQLGWLKMGYFGHGENFQATTEYRVSAFVKKRMLKRVDYWFAYTDVSRQSLSRQGVSDSIITVVNNTLAESPNSALSNTTPELNTFVYIGGLYALKLLTFLVEAASLVAEEVHDFQLHIIGEGPDKPILLEAANTRHWLHVHGSLYGIDRDRILARSNAILMPGLVGLIAIDSFQFQRPIITTDAGEHSPEIAYLKDGVNCLIDKGDVSISSYANKIKLYINDIELQTALRSGCRESANNYSIDRMASNFASAILK